jgi:tetratricopeptide (TPR) repeat protein
MPASIRELFERRVPHVLAIYLGAGWGIIEFTSFLEERYSLSTAWTDLALFSWALLIPSVLLFTYNHGRRGPDGWHRSTLIGVPLNLVIAVAVLGTAFSGRDLGATTTSVTVTDEAGNTVERKIARSAFRKRLALFNFDLAQPGDTAAAWLRVGAMTALATDLSQDIFLDMRVPAHFAEQLREAGFEDGQGVPVSLMRKLAEEKHLPYFLTGSVGTGADGTTVTVTLHETSSGERLGERTATDTDVFRAIDALSVQVKQDLELPSTRPEGVTDLPVAELLSAAPGAYRALIDGQTAAMASDWAAAQAALERAVAHDPTFALAHYALFQARLLQGRTQEAMPALDAAMQNLYRMPERSQFLVKTDYYFMRRDMEKAFAVAIMWVELYPDDLQGHALTAQYHILRGEREEAVASYRRILDLDPQQHELLLQIGQLEEELGKFDDALATYGDYARQFRDDVTAQLRLARVNARTGQLDTAQAAYDRALLIDPTNVEAMTELAGLHRSRGEFEAALRLLDEAGAGARTPQDRARVATALQSYHEFRGEMDAAVAAMQQRFTLVQTYEAPITVLQLRLSQLGTYVRAGQAPRAAEILADVRGQLAAPLDDFWRLGQLAIANTARDSAAIVEAAAGVQKIMETFGFRFLQGTLARADATLAELRGDWRGALAAYERERSLEPGSLGVARHRARCHRQLGQLDEAQRAIEEHLRSVPASPESNLEAARIALARGDAAGARSHVDRAALALADADPGFELRAELTRLQSELGTR